EYDRRLENVRSVMEQKKLDILIVTDVADLCYLTGYTTFEVSVQCALIVSPHTTILIVPAIEVGPAVYSSRVEQVIGYPWESLNSAAVQIVQAVRDLKSHATTVGVDFWGKSIRPGVIRYV